MVRYELVDVDREEDQIKLRDLEQVPETQPAKKQSKFVQEEPEETDEQVFGEVLFVSGNTFDISRRVFDAIQENGLVYNGRLIVQNDFATVDPCILGAGRICEFSQRYRGLAKGRQLRMDLYDQREVGEALAERLIARLEGMESDPDHLPAFEKPVGQVAEIFPDY